MLREVPALGLNHQPNITESVALVRRRSGGGTVFHDYGNLNYCVICPAATFTRDKHAKMVTQAIRTQDARARVNERHDIVLDQDALEIEKDKLSGADLCRSSNHPNGVSLKISGSAYKLTRQRALHHGTCLISSPNIDNISRYLKSPARPFMKARGVESVRSPIGNILGQAITDVEASLNDFRTRVIQAFANIYKINRSLLNDMFNLEPAISIPSRENCVGGYVGDEVSNIEEVKTGIVELQVRLPSSITSLC